MCDKKEISSVGATEAPIKSDEEKKNKKSCRRRYITLRRTVNHVHRESTFGFRVRQLRRARNRDVQKSFSRTRW